MRPAGCGRCGKGAWLAVGRDLIVTAQAESRSRQDLLARLHGHRLLSTQRANVLHQMTSCPCRAVLVPLVPGLPAPAGQHGDCSRSVSKASFHGPWDVEGGDLGLAPCAA